MKVLIKKMSKLRLLAVELVLGILLMVAAAVGLPWGVASIDEALLSEPYVLGVVIAGILMFCALGYFCFIRQFVLYRKYPEVQAEMDSEFLYIHTAKKQAKIPIAALENTFIHVELPFLFHKDLVRELIVHLFSEEYGHIHLEVPGFGKYKLRFVPHAWEAKNQLESVLSQALASLGYTAENG